MVSPEVLFNTLVSEVEVIENISQQDETNKIKVLFYYSDYSGINYGKLIKIAQVRRDSTVNQMFYRGQLIKTMELLRNYFIAYYPGRYVYTYNLMLDWHYIKNSINVLVLTHVPYDLYGYKSCNKLDLIESNTGLLKPRNLWYTKFYPIKDTVLNTIPFCKQMLFLFGDHVMFSPISLKTRKQIVNISVEKGWNHTTSIERIKQCLSLSNDSEIKQLSELMI